MEPASRYTTTRRSLQTLQCTRWTRIEKSRGVRARCVLPRYCAGWPYLRLAGSAVKKRTRLGCGGALPSHVRTLVGPALVHTRFPFLRLSAPLRSISFFLHDRHTRRLIKSATKNSSHHHRAENGSLTDFLTELLRDLLPRHFLSSFCIPFVSLSHVSSARCLLHSCPDVFITIIQYSKRRVFLRLSANSSFTNFNSTSFTICKIYLNVFHIFNSRRGWKISSRRRCFANVMSNTHCERCSPR